MVSFHPLPNLPVLWDESLRMIVIADLHIGIENELMDQGVHVSSQTDQMKIRLQKICEKYHPDHLMILGDIKHSIPSTPFHEKKELYSFLMDLTKVSTIHIVPGNHDGGIERLTPDSVIIHPSDGFLLSNIGFVHGHRWPNKKIMNADYLVFGHNHPTIMLSDRLGFQNYEPCWMKTSLLPDKTKNIYPVFNENMTVIMLPAFNELCGGIAVNRDELVGPLKHIIDITGADVFLLDGTHLGKVEEI